MEKKKENVFQKMVLQFGNLLVLVLTMVLLFIFFAVQSKYFLTVSNMLNLLQQVCVLGIVSAGITLIILTGSLDLSVGSMLALSGIFAAWFIQMTDSWMVGLVGGILVGTLAGAINAAMITVLKMNPLIVTLGMSTVWEGVTKLLNNGTAIGIFNNEFKFIGQGRILNVPVVIFIMVGVYIVLILMLKYTKFGRNAYAVGGSAKAALYSGINVSKVRFAIFTMAGLMAGIAGVCYASIVGSGTVTAGADSTMDAIAAVVLGGASLSGGVANIFGTLLGVLLLGTIDNGLSILGVTSYWQLVVKGAILIFAVFVDVMRGGEKYE
ncbi:MAG: ABC transporter permease [Eubacteriales bacterium]|nr:ABC transporter permease [Eubacteriales bacterium]